MVRIAEPRDLEGCLNLLIQIGSSKKINQNYLYLNDKTDGFTLVVEKDAKLVALSTFTIRRTYQKNKNCSFLYWENLIVDKDNRDGVAYLSIIGYVRKLLRRGEFDDIFFVARRKKALQVHKAARFKTFGYFQIVIESIRFNLNVKNNNNLTCYEYSDFTKLFNSENACHSKSVNEYVGLENASNIEIQRWLFGKNGRIILDDFNKRIYFWRSLLRNKFVEVNLTIPSCYTDDIPNLTKFCSSIIVINLRIRRYLDKRESIPCYLPKLCYEALYFKGEKSLDDFQIWEHDAW